MASYSYQIIARSLGFAILLVAPCGYSRAASPALDRSPVDLVYSQSGGWLATANETSGTVSLIRASDGKRLDEAKCGNHPADIALSKDGLIVVTGAWSGDVSIFEVVSEKLAKLATIQVGFEPTGIAISPNGEKAFIGLVASGEVAEIDLVKHSLVRRFPVGSWPKFLTVSKDGKRLAVGLSGSGEITVLDTESGKPLYEEPLANGLNLGHMITSANGDYAYFTWMIYRTNPINVGNIRRGWILASRIGRVRLDGPAYREAISLDVPGKAVADPHGIVISDDGERLVASSSGTHELLVYRLPDLPFVSTGGPGDLIDRGLQHDRDRFSRIDVGGRPLGMQIAKDNRTVFVANYMRNSVQVVDLVDQAVTREIELGGSTQPSTLVRQGMSIFYDGQRSLDQWYSCHSCHQNGGVNSRPMDTWNDGTEMTLKTVLPLFHVTETQPWTWHGWQTDLDEAMHKSITSTMQGKRPSEKDKQALVAFIKSLKEPPNPFVNADGSLSEAAKRGEVIFNSAKAACADCHNGDHFTDGQVHDVGLGSKEDYYEGYNTPSLRGMYRKVRWLHNGRAKTLNRVINDLHSPDKVSGHGTFNEQESADLIEYLKSL